MWQRINVDGGDGVPRLRLGFRVQDFSSSAVEQLWREGGWSSNRWWFGGAGAPPRPRVASGLREEVESMEA
jgi:hypothetical protein